MKARKQSTTSYPIPFLLTLASDHISPATGLTPTVTIAKNGAAFGAPAGAVTEIGNGWYQLAGNATDRNTVGELLIHATGGGADPADERYLIVPFDPFDAVALGLTNMDAQASLIKAKTDNLPTDPADESLLEAAIAGVLSDTNDIQTRLPAALVGGRMDASVGAMANDVITAAAIAADALAEVTTDVLTGEALTELPQAKPPATPTLAEAIMLLYMAARNLIEVDATEKRIANDAGTVIVKKPLSDSGTVYQEAEMVAGP